jgi:choline dehydrogenase-like flavoprotein
MDHPLQISLALAPRPVDPFRGPLSTGGIEELRDGPFRARRGAFRVEVGNDGWSFPAGDPPAQAAGAAADGALGAAGMRALGQRLARQLRFASLVEPLPDAANRVTLAEERDALGIPRPALAYRYDEYTRRGLAAAQQVHDRVFGAMGATDVRHQDGPFAAGHIMGTCRMGDDPRRSVVDRDLRLHGHPNCFVLGSSVFPTVGTANPTLTIAALSLRAVDAVRASLTA